MKSSRLIPSLLAFGLAGAAQAQNVGAASANLNLAGQAAGQAASLSTANPDPELNWRDPQWLNRQAQRSRWSYQLGLEQQVRSPVMLGPQAAVREAVWAGVSYDVTRRLSGGVEAPVLQRDTGWASRMNFEKPKDAGLAGLAGLRGAFSYQLSSQSKLTLRPQARRVMLSYSATW